MKKLALIPLFAVLALTGCENLDIEPGVPDCLEKKTRAFNQQPICDKKATIKEYKFQDKIVYVLDPGNCNADSGAEVIDSDCQKIGYLGGFTGNTKINGIEFSSATYIRTVWKN